MINAPAPHPTVRILVVACAGMLLFAAEDAASQTVGITTMLPFDYGVTGIRADDGDDVVITGGTGLPNLIQPTPAFIYRGTLADSTSVTTTGRGVRRRSTTEGRAEARYEGPRPARPPGRGDPARPH